MIVVENVNKLKNSISTEYSDDEDIVLYNYSLGTVRLFEPGDVMILYPEDAHRGAICTNNFIKVRKIVVKVPCL